MQDLENRLKSLGDRVSQQAPMELRPTPHALRKIRVGRIIRSGAVLATAAALVFGGFAGARSLTIDDAAPVQPADSPSRTGSTSIAEGSGEVRARAVMDACEFFFGSGCSDDLPSDGLLSVQISASQDGGEVSGSGSIHGAGLDESFTVGCSRYVDGDSIALGGTFDEGDRTGKDIALVIQDLDPDSLAIWFGKEDGCESMLDGIGLRSWENLTYQPVRSGNFTLRHDG